MKKKIMIIFISIVMIIGLFFLFRKSFIDIFYDVKDFIVDFFDKDKLDDDIFEYVEADSLLSNDDDIKLTDVDGNSNNYTFIYNDELFNVSYTYDNWHIVDSYKVRNKNDMIIICEALIEEHPIHGIDLESFRTAEDMAYEWLQHNMVYEFFPIDSSWRNSAKSVDLDPKDQGKSLVQMYEDRTGETFSISKIFK